MEVLVHYAVEPTATPEAATVHYTIESRGSTFKVKASATGLLSALGHSPTIAIPDFEGEIFFNPEAVENSSLTLTIRSASLAVADDVSEKDREEINRKMHQEVLESDGYSDIVYECSRLTASQAGEDQYWVELNGDLTLRGIKRNQAVSARVSINGTTVRATGDFSIRQSDYEIPPVSALGGAIRLKDELKFSYDISARKQP